MIRNGLTLQGLPKACNEALILAALTGEARHGYQIVLDIESKSGGTFTLKHGTLYPILHRLEKDGLIEGTWSDEGPKAKRKSYRLTQSGRSFAKKRQTELTDLVERLFGALDLPLAPESERGDPPAEGGTQ